MFAILFLFTSPSIFVSANGLQSPPVFNNYPAWQAYISNVPAPQAGCFVATYPNPVWQPTHCATAPTQTEVVGNLNDWIAKAPTGSLIRRSTSSGAILASGITSENDVCVKPFLTTCKMLGGGLGSNAYSIQINSNLGFKINFNGRATKGWEQFVFLNTEQGFLNCCGQVYIEYWLLGYFTTYGACPPSSQDPPGGGTGWFQSGGNCVFNTSGVGTPSVYPATGTTYVLSQVSFQANANFQSSNLDQAVMCIVSQGCYTNSLPASVLNLDKHWTQSELNVVGYIDGSRAEFNSGTSITIQNGLFLNTNAFGTIPTCVKGGTTGETNNLNLGACSTGKTFIRFTESN
jgi:hypothetical protein